MWAGVLYKYGLIYMCILKFKMACEIPSITLFYLVSLTFEKGDKAKVWKCKHLSVAFWMSQEKGDKSIVWKQKVISDFEIKGTDNTVTGNNTLNRG